MTELDEIQIDPNPEQAPPSEEPFRYTWHVVAGAVVILLIAAGTLFMRSRIETPPPDAPVVAEPADMAPAPVAEAVPEEPLVLPPLAESDGLIRELVRTLSANPELVSMLAGEELVRRFAAAIDNIARGESPRVHLPGVKPEGSFAATEASTGSYVDPASYDRYNTIAAVISSLDAEGTLAAYRNVKPLIQESYRDLGYPQADFDPTLRRAIRHLLETPVVNGELEVVPGVRSYKLADPALESLSEAQKHLLRMGPANVQRIQAKLRELYDGLG